MDMRMSGGDAPTPGSRGVGDVVADLFRREAGRLVSSLTRIFGPQRLDLAEEVVQEALVRALEVWPFRGVPDDPAAWIVEAARNRALDRLRRDAVLRRKVEPAVAALAARRPAAPEPHGEPDPLEDDELRMMLLCCHPAIPPEGRVALTLKTVGGLGTREIARAFLAEEATIAQRLVRAKQRIRDHDLVFELPPGEAIGPRLESVLEVIYLLFNEGYGAAEGEDLVRHDLAAEAIRLGRLLARHPETARPAVHALLALMLLQAARLPSRTGPEGELALLADQDRSRWERRLIAEGFRHLDRAAAGEEMTAYHLEAGIAACHAVAPSFAETDWAEIARLYDSLLALVPSPVVALNRAVAIAQTRGPEEGLRAAQAIAGDASLARYVLLPATLAELHRQIGERDAAAERYREALARPCTGPERRFLERRLASLEKV
jgi:RNA polymerase sigma-70 factor (ECF subfamily)